MSVPMCSHVVPKEARGLAVSTSILRLYVWTETMHAPVKFFRRVSVPITQDNSHVSYVGGRVLTGS